MKKNIVLKFILSIGIIALMFTSACNTDTNETTVASYVRLGTLTANSSSFKIVLDDKTILYPQNSISYGTMVAGDRVIVRFSVLENVVENNQTNYKITLSNIASVLTKKPKLMTNKNIDSLGNDPINIGSVWTSSKYLNIDFQVYTGGTNTKHYINLAIDSIQPKSTDTVNFILKHNAYSDSPATASTGVISFDMSDYLKANKITVLKVKYKNYYSVSKTYSLKFSADSTYQITNSYYGKINVR